MTENKLFPGRENYTGPITGWFGLAYKDSLIVHSIDILKRVDFLKEKESIFCWHDECITILHNMIYIGDIKDICLEYSSIYNRRHSDVTEDADIRRKISKGRAEGEILKYIFHHIPDCAWDEVSNQLDLSKQVA